MTLAEYIKNRRLALANQDLISGGKLLKLHFVMGIRQLKVFQELFESGVVICLQRLEK